MLLQTPEQGGGQECPSPPQAVLAPVAVEAQPVHHAAGTEGQRVARLVDDAHEGVGARDPGQPVLGAVTAMHQVGQVTLGKNKV